MRSTLEHFLHATSGTPRAHLLLDTRPQPQSSAPPRRRRPLSILLRPDEHLRCRPPALVRCHHRRRIHLGHVRRRIHVGSRPIHAHDPPAAIPFPGQPLLISLPYPAQRPRHLPRAPRPLPRLLAQTPRDELRHLRRNIPPRLRDERLLLAAVRRLQRRCRERPLRRLEHGP